MAAGPDEFDWRMRIDLCDARIEVKNPSSRCDTRVALARFRGR